MFQDTTNIKGTIIYEKETIAGIAALCIPGLAEMKEKKSQLKTIKVESDNGDVVIHTQIIMDYGTPISAAGEIQKKIKNDIEQMTNLYVKAVNIDVVGIRIATKENAVSINRN